ncbi:MAG: PQQ-dependent sugar dehydrogenase [Lysobacteraceae bacterium]
MRRLFAFALLAAATALPADPAAAQLPPDLRLETVQGGFSDITTLRFPDDGSERMFVVEQGGRIKIFDDGNTLATPFLRLCISTGAGCYVPSGGFTSSGERGLLGLAFHPQFASNRQLYLNYTNGSGHTVIARVQASAGNANLADTGTFSILLTIDQDFPNHNGGDIHFGPDGYLYIGMGDGGSGGDPCSRAQTLRPADLVGGSCTITRSRALLGKMLRIDVDNATAAGSHNLCGVAAGAAAPYAVPTSNPYASDATGICAEIWAAGLRNPWRFSFDRQTNDLWIADVGQGAREEVNLEPASSTGGLNYGWRCREGTQSYSTSAPYCNNPPPFTAPAFDYARSGGRCSITGGYRYRGPAPSLDGLYFYGDYCQGRVLVAQANGPSWTQTIWSPTSIGNIRTFGEDGDGNVYVGTVNTVFLITGDPPGDEIFADGFEPSGNR